MNSALAATGTCFVMLTGCVSMRYGLLRDANEFLISQPNGATIGICGGDLDDESWAINTWGAAIGRQYKVVVACDSPDIIVHPADSDQSMRYCREHQAWFRSWARSNKYPQQVITCNGSRLSRAVLLHEFGHLFGLCDLYETGRNNCAKLVTGTWTFFSNEVMEYNNRAALGEGDIEGIREVARRSDAYQALMKQAATEE